MRNSLRITLALAFALLPTALLHAEAGSDFLRPRPATVLPSHLNVREEPGVRHRILSTLRHGAVVLYGEKTLRRGWVRIVIPSRDVQGWVLLRLLHPLPKEELPTIVASSYAVVHSASLNLRAGPGTQHGILRPLPRGTHLTLSNTAQDGWRQVRTSEDEQGWVSTKYLRVYEPQALPVSVNRSQLAQYTSPLEASILEYMNETYAKKKVSRKDQLFMVVQDLTSGTLLVAIRPRRRVKAASLIKVPILHAYQLERVRKRVKHTSGRQDHLARMIRYSSNASTNVILKRLGGPNKVQRLLRETNMYRELRLVEYIPADGRTYRNKLSMADLSSLFHRLWIGRVLGPGFSDLENEQASAQMLHLLSLSGRSDNKDRLKDGTCFAGNQTVRIWDKTGFVKGLNGNAGIIEIDSPHGRRAYSIVAAIERPNFRTIRGNASRWSAKVAYHLRRISELAYAFFTSRYDAFSDCGHDRLLQYATRALEQSTALKASL